MKILVIGIDGGDERIIRAMPMPNLHKFLDQNISLNIEEDLWNRGWVGILTGVHGRESGAFYQKPVLNSTHTTTQKFNIDDYASIPEIKPLWDRLSQNGHSVGFMNVPSMFPAPKVNGFVVSGGGAGARTSGAARIPETACYPTHIRDLLQKSGYILDTRFVASGIRKIEILFDQLIEMTEKRTDVFTDICGHQKPGIGFLVYRSVCVFQYLAMSEIEALIENKLDPENFFQEKILSFYQFFDKQVEKLVTVLQPDNSMLVSDHGQSPLLYNINLNVWLQKDGFQTSSSHGANIFKKSAKTLAGYLPKNLKQMIKQSAPKAAAKVSGLNANWEHTAAFSITSIPGIYINDRKRFGGEIGSGSEYQELVETIVAGFNRDPENQQYNLKARPYRQVYKDAKYEALLPDIWIEHPDTFRFLQTGNYISPNVAYGPIPSLEGIERDVYTGTKGRNPLLCVSPHLADLVQPNDTMDLTLAYKLIVRGMER